ncbi:Major sperm protein [Aphelenchoides fujianensis]|nr:Major sperm protein [Aphelenchoides fujianensis]
MSDLPLKLEPAERLVFAGKKLGAEPANATLKVTNPTADRMAFKIKCTSNEMFRIRPVIGVVKAKEETTLIFNAGKSVPENGKHYFAPVVVEEASSNARLSAASLFCERHTYENRGSQSAKQWREFTRLQRFVREHRFNGRYPPATGFTQRKKEAIYGLIGSYNAFSTGLLVWLLPAMRR